MSSVQIRDVRKSFGGFEVLHGVSIPIEDGAFVVLVGPSGCGKSTLLRMLAGLENITSGTISIGDRVVNNVQPKERDIAMVFQNYALYPHMTVADNMGFSLKLRGASADEISKGVNRAAEFEREPHIIGDRHMRIERIVLKHHRDIAFFRLDVVDDPVADRNRPGGDVFESGEHPQQGRLATAGGADQNHESAVLDRDRDAVQDLKATKRFPHVANLHRRHLFPPKKHAS